jgi:hypothetical protein
MGRSVSLQNSTLTIEEFHAKLQEATNFPLRPFVIPFLKVSESSTFQATGMVYTKALGKKCIQSCFVMAGIQCGKWVCRG